MKSRLTMMVILLLIITTFGVACAAPAPQVKEVVVTPTAEAKSYEGVEVNVLTFTGPQIAEPLQRRGPDFTERSLQ